MVILLNIIIWLGLGALGLFLFKRKYPNTIKGDESLLVLFGPYSLLSYFLFFIYIKFRK